jgi:hypothetical protein
VRLAWPKRPKTVCSPSYADIRSRANTTRGLDFEHMIKARAHKGGVRIGKTSKKLASICCPQHRETKADTIKATEANRRRGPGNREKVRSKRINLEGNQCESMPCIAILISTSKNPCCFLLLLILFLQQN